MAVGTHTVTVSPNTSGIKTMPITQVVFTMQTDSTEDAISVVLQYLDDAVNLQSLQQAVVT
jgi:hypothetical protein